MWEMQGMPYRPPHAGVHMDLFSLSRSKLSLRGPKAHPGHKSRPRRCLSRPGKLDSTCRRHAQWHKANTVCSSPARSRLGRGEGGGPPGARRHNRPAPHEGLHVQPRRKARTPARIASAARAGKAAGGTGRRTEDRTGDAQTHGPGVSAARSARIARAPAQRARGGRAARTQSASSSPRRLW